MLCQHWDFVYELEGDRCTLASTVADFVTAESTAFQCKGSFTLTVYNCYSKTFRTVRVLADLGHDEATPLLEVEAIVAPPPEDPEDVLAGFGETLQL